MRGTTTAESTRAPGQEFSWNEIETYDGHEIDLQKFDYEVAPIEDKAAGEHGNPSLVGNRELVGWKIVGPCPDGHPKQRLIAREKTNPHAVRAAREKAKKDAKTEPTDDNPTIEQLLRGGATSQGKAIRLGDALAQHPSEEQIAAQEATADRLKNNPEVRKMVERGIDLDKLDQI